MEELKNRTINITVGEIMEIRHLLCNLESKLKDALNEKEMLLAGMEKEILVEGIDRSSYIDTINSVINFEKDRLSKTIEAIKNIEMKIEEA